MSDAIIVALITAGATILGQWLISKSQRDKEQQELRNTLIGIQTRLDEHNNYAQRIGGLAEDVNHISQAMARIETDIDWLKNRQ